MRPILELFRPSACADADVLVISRPRSSVSVAGGVPGNGTTLRVASLCRESVGTYQSEAVQIMSPHLNLRTDSPMVHVVEVMA